MDPKQSILLPLFGRCAPDRCQLHTRARQKEPETAIYNHNITIPGFRQPWVLIDKNVQKRLENQAMIKISMNVKETKNGEKSKSTTVFPGKQSY